ncbi:MAG TPA: DUF4364 domain-containing protein [Lachnospiraceae bacterium]|jgi:predicted transcriptional regulator|nr:DUF4364 domain-containing protein [Lachnospiraceae bacterium]
MAEASTLYKLIILYMLRKVTFPLTNAQITEFIVGKEYTDYFHVQEVINDLLEADLIEGEKIRNTSTYQATQAGEKTLEYFSYMISDAIKADIDEYLLENAFEMRNESCTRADYVRTETREYAVRCYVQEGKEKLIDLTFNVPTEEEAERVCARWPSKSQEIYMYIMEKLLLKIDN